VNKDSIRNKVAEAKQKATAAMVSGNTPPETKAAIEALFLVIDILVAVFLEKKVRKNSGNSGLPPSQNNGSNGNRNNGSGERAKLDGGASNVTQTQTTETKTPKKCKRCGQGLGKVMVSGTEERQEIDLIYEIVTRTVVAQIKECPHCGQVNKGEFPAGMDGKLQYGMGVRAAIINFLVVQMMSLQRVQEHMQGLLGRSISQSIMLKYLLQFSASLKEWETRKIKEILKSGVMNCDETSVRVNKVNWWVHSYSSGDITLKFLHRNRGTEAIEDIGILPRYGGIIIHDCWSSYFSYTGLVHALCGAHLLRELKFVEDSCSYEWATKVKKLLQGAAQTVASRPKKRVLNKEEYRELQTNYRQALSDGLDEMPLFPGRSGKKGRAKCTDAQNLWARLWELEDSVLLFARVKEVDFTNNRAERDLRVSKVKQKVAGCFRTEEMARVFYRISSYLKSMRYMGYSTVEAISLALEGKIPS
jgi:transposase